MTHLSSGVRPNCISGFPRGGRSSEQPQAANQQDEPAQTAAASNESETEQQATAKDSDS